MVICSGGRQAAGSTSDRRSAANRYARLVAADRDVRLWDELRQQIYLGDEVFVERMQKLADPKRKAAREIPKAQRRTTRSLAHKELGLSVSRSRLIARAEWAKSKT